MFNLWLVDWNSTQQSLVSTRFVTATQLKYRVWIASGVKNKVVSEVLRKYDVCVCEARLLFLKIPHQDTTPQILKLKFPVHALGPKEKRK